MNKKKQTKSGLPKFRIALLLLFLAVAGFAYYNWPSRSEYISNADSPGQPDKDAAVPVKLRQRTRTVSPELSDDEYKEMMLRKDKQMLDRRRAELRRMKKKFSLKRGRNLYEAQKEELMGLIREHGVDSAPNSVTRDAAIRLKRLEEDAPY